MPAELKVGIFAQLLPGSAGGIESNLLELLRNLKRADPQLHTLTIGPGSSSAWLGERVPQTEVLPWTVIRYQVEDSRAACQRAPLLKRPAALWHRSRVRRSPALASQGHHVASGRLLTAALRERQVELVHFPYQRYFETDLPFIFEPWDLQHLHYPENFTDKEVRFREHLYREACRCASLVVTPTRWGKRDLVSKFGLDARKIAVVPRGPGELPAVDSNARTVPALPSDYVLYPAKFWRHKNHLRLFEALGHLRARGCVIPLVCTGEPPAKVPEELRQVIARCGLQDQIVFPGNLDRTQFAEVLANAKILVFPSLFEGFGIPVIEAMNLGIPVACSRIGPLEELARDAAEYFDPTVPIDIARAIEALWSSQDRRKELERLARERARVYDWTRGAQDFTICYRRIAGRLLSTEEEARFASLIE